MTAAAVDLIAIGASWGGLHAVSTVLRALPGDFPLPIVVVQHRGKDATSLLGELLQDCTPLRVREVEDKDAVEGGTVFLAPPDYHLLVEDGHFALSLDEPVRYSRPSIDVLFGSAADAYAPRLAGVALTGANDDGARGLACIAERGGIALVQDPDDAESPIMPRAALQRVPGAEVLTLAALPERLVALAGGALSPSTAAGVGRPSR